MSKLPVFTRPSASIRTSNSPRVGGKAVRLPWLMRMAFDPPLSRTLSSAVAESNSDREVLSKTIAPLFVAVSKDEPSKSNPAVEKLSEFAERVIFWPEAMSPLSVLKPVKVASIALVLARLSSVSASKLRAEWIVPPLKLNVRAVRVPSTVRFPSFWLKMSALRTA